jgi:alkanesulfonate monooxygenase SsuD/methylene tetrahydromethanopterin reductase-like flavin-dependent oxidoreductase (luciferase family)
VGREPKSITLTLRAPMEVRPKGTKAGGGPRPLLQGTAAEVAADLQQYIALGVTHFVFDPTVPDVKAVLVNMERFADEVRPKLKRVRA